MSSSEASSKLADRAVRKWALQQKLQEQATKKTAVSRPIITIARDFGARGSALGELVAERLGFEHWDKELVDELVKEMGVPESVIAQMDEQAYTRLDLTLTEVLVGSSKAQSGYLNSLREAFRKIDEQGAAVIVGRGAHYVVPHEHCLRVRVVSPLPVRVRAYAMREGLSERDAERKIRALDDARRDFVWRAFRMDVTDSHHYDLVINTGVLRAEAALELIIAAYHHRFEVP
ncbi:MAG: cytidylate kinase-like family protein [Myxococcales bacterium]|nr:cytidylate kinase-like family protein [Myxococcales bacterium]